MAESDALALWDELSTGFPITDRRLLMADGSVVEQEVGKVIFADADLIEGGRIHKTEGTQFPWPPLLGGLRVRVESVLERRFHFCVCLHYKNGMAHSGLHMDPPAYGSVSLLPIVSLGAPREFVFQNQQDASDTCKVRVENGSLLIMGEHCQDRYLHGVPEAPASNRPRLSLSFRPFGWPEK
jgi:alkylated DNA repair dioxygenase AlkB